MSWHTRLHRDYDKLPEWERFFVIIAVTLPCVLLAAWPEFSWVNVLGMLCLLALMASRMTYIHGRK